jgi:hypothetical protein
MLLPYHLPLWKTLRNLINLEIIFISNKEKTGNGIRKIGRIYSLRSKQNIL